LVALSAILGASTLLLSGCSWQEVFGLGWPTGITREAHANRDLWVWSVIASFVVGAIVWALIFWAMAFHRKKKTDTELPRQFGYNMPLELVLTVVPFLIISVLFYFTVVVQEKMMDHSKPAEVTIDVTAFQWNWKFGYQKVAFKDNTFSYDGADAARKEAMKSKPEGKDEHGEEKVGAIRGENPEDRSYLNFDKVETIGTSTEIPILVLPKGKRIEFQIASADVIHGFWVPEFLFKRDVIPNLPGQRDPADRRVRGPLHRDVRHVPLDDELRGARRGAGAVQGLPAVPHRPPEGDQRRRPGVDRPAAGGPDDPSVRLSPRRAGRFAGSGEQVGDTPCISKPDFSRF